MDATDTVLGTALTEETAHVNDLMTRLGDWAISKLPALGGALLVFVCGMVAVKLLKRLLHHTLERSRLDRTAASFLEQLIGVFLYLIVAIIVLSVLQVPMTSIITVLGAMGLAIGLALQNSLSNVAGGFLLLLSKPLKVGDFVKIEGVEGTVTAVGILQTKVVRLDGNTVFFPNGKVTDAVILNYNETPARRVDLRFGIRYESDFEAAKTLIRGIIDKHPLTSKTQKHTVRVAALEDSAVVLDVLVWTTHADYWSVRYDMLEQIKTALDAAGIGIPYPQLDVHLPADIRKETNG